MGNVPLMQGRPQPELQMIILEPDDGSRDEDSQDGESRRQRRRKPSSRSKNNNNDINLNNKNAKSNPKSAAVPMTLPAHDQHSQQYPNFVPMPYNPYVMYPQGPPLAAMGVVPGPYGPQYPPQSLAPVKTNAEISEPYSLQTIEQMHQTIQQLEQELLDSGMTRQEMDALKKDPEQARILLQMAKMNMNLKEMKAKLKCPPRSNNIELGELF